MIFYLFENYSTFLIIYKNWSKVLYQYLVDKIKLWWTGSLICQAGSSRTLHVYNLEKICLVKRIKKKHSNLFRIFLLQEIKLFLPCENLAQKNYLLCTYPGKCKGLFGNLHHYFECWLVYMYIRYLLQSKNYVLPVYLLSVMK